jgi:hypothetical protein
MTPVFTTLFAFLRKVLTSNCEVPRRASPARDDKGYAAGEVALPPDESLGARIEPRHGEAVN